MGSWVTLWPTSNDEIYVEVYHSDYAISEDELLTPTDTDSDRENIRNIHKGTSYDPRCPIEMMEFHVGMKFESACQFTTSVKNYAIWNGFNIRFLSLVEKKLKLCATNIAHGGYISIKKYSS